MTRNHYTNLLLLSPTYLRLLVFFTRPFMWISSVYNYVTPKEVWLSYIRALKPGDTAVQAGVAMRTKKDSVAWYDNSSYLWAIAKRVGPNGRVIVIEPDPINLEKLKSVVADSPFSCEFTFVQKALFRRKDKGNFLIAHRTSWNRIDNVHDSKDWKYSDDNFSGRKIDVELDTLDNILNELDLTAAQISYVCLTINGAEYDALLGMEQILSSSENLSLAVIAGRDLGSVSTDNNIGFIEDQPDHVAISKLLNNYGFNSHLRRFKTQMYGYLVCTKGNKRAFL